VSRSRNDQALTIRATERLVKVAQRRGLKNYKVAVTPKEKGKPPEYALIVFDERIETNTNPWDEVLSDAAHEKRPA
jgi:hypothetical protein